jgi:hypothetical protein
MLERRTTAHVRSQVPSAAVLPVPGQDDPPVPVPEPGQSPAGPLLDFARKIAAEHHHTCGQPITRDTLRARLGVSNQLASELLRQLRTTTQNTT